MSEKVILLFVDALSTEYLQKDLCPNISSLAKDGYYSKLEPFFAFTGIGTTILTGAWPNSTGIWVEYVLRREGTASINSIVSTLMWLTDFIPSDRACWDARLVINKLIGKEYVGTPAVIPSKYLGYFRTKLQRDYTKRNSIDGIKTIFDILREEGRSYDYYSPARSDEKQVKQTLKSVHEKNLADFTFLHLFSLDPIGHKYGPESEVTKRAVRRIDEYVGRIMDAAKSGKMHVVLLSDHGMSPIKKYYDLMKVLESLPIDFGRDYFFFLDSTMARFWFRNEKSKRVVMKVLSSFEWGHILNDENLKVFHIDKLGIEQGELFFVLNDQYCIYPDFFRRHSKPKGMHGYAFAEYDQPVFISPKSGLFKTQNVQFVDIMPTVLTLLDIETPPSCEGRSIV